MTASENTYPRIQLFDETGDELRLRAPVRGGLDYQPFNFGVERVVGEPDLSRIVEVRFNQAGSSTVWLGRVTFHEPLPPTVLITLEDQYLSNYSAVPPILQEYGYPATIYVNPGYVGAEDYFTSDQLQALERAGWDVCNYTIDHADLVKLDEAGQRQQIAGGRRWLILDDLETGADYFAYPYDHYDQTSLDMVDQWHRLGFAGGYPATGALPNRQLVPHSSVGGVAEARRMIDLTVRFGGVTCLYYTNFDDIGERGFRQSIEYLHRRAAAGDVTVATARDLAGLLEA
jgi:peptidoglycan/xylan/chitin deacetylase (PgdA/CDA1 family)